MSVFCLLCNGLFVSEGYSGDGFSCVHRAEEWSRCTFQIKQNQPDLIAYSLHATFVGSSDLNITKGSSEIYYFDWKTPTFLDINVDQQTVIFTIEYSATNVGEKIQTRWADGNSGDPIDGTGLFFFTRPMYGVITHKYTSAAKWRIIENAPE